MTTGKVNRILSNLLEVKIEGKVRQNEICFVESRGVSLRAEVIRIVGDIASIQVFEPTSGVRVGDPVKFSGKLLEITLGPGLLSRNYDGLQNDLEAMEGTFLTVGEITAPVSDKAIFAFEPLAKVGDKVSAGHWLGKVKENQIDHKIMVPFTMEGDYEVTWLANAGDYPITETMAKIKDDHGNETSLTMTQRWPVKKAIRAYKEKLRPYKILQTGLRVIDTFNPIPRGGTGYIPGAFGTGKTVLQQAIAKNSEADIIVLVACGERANEVVEIFTEFPELVDPRTGKTLDERTTIICNTSNMPVAAREASVYVGMTMAEYYRAMGYNVMLLADSTSRWAQALREMSNRLEELPGDDAYPVDLSATIANFYSRAGIVTLPNEEAGSVTFIGTLSPAGGNFKEPVTESTSKVANSYYALSQARADAKRYPAIDILESYSKYLDYEEFIDNANEHIENGWVQKVLEAKNLLKNGRSAYEQINILGDDAVPIDYHIQYWKSELIDFTLIQQDSFDEVDQNCPMERQAYMLNLVLNVCHKEFAFDDFEEVRTYFQQMTNKFKQMNFEPYQSDKFKQYEKEIADLIDEKTSTLAN